MVEAMPSPESKAGAAESALPDFPVFAKPLVEPSPLALSWSEAVWQMAPLRDYYMHHFDSPERRFADKNPRPFEL
jgi:hypothetical protein